MVVIYQFTVVYIENQTFTNDPSKAACRGKNPAADEKTLADDVINEPTGSRQGMLPAIQYLVSGRKS
ncbi:hypothetical protein [Chitinophaga sp.]|uniref:hypothetical protein n=1 Tax=Chitinophaga sp. TaxID=1869181 RepID=UPI002F925337